MRELDELPLPYIFAVQAYEAIKNTPFKRHIDEFWKILYGTDDDIFATPENGD